MSGSQGYKDLIDEKCISANGQVDAHSSEVPLSVCTVGRKIIPFRWSRTFEQSHKYEGSVIRPLSGRYNC